MDTIATHRAAAKGALTSSHHRTYRDGMRTTLQLDEDVYRAAKSLADVEQRSLGEVISRLARKALAPDPRITTRSGFPVFSVSPGAAPITNEMVKAALEDA